MIGPNKRRLRRYWEAGTLSQEGYSGSAPGLDFMSCCASRASATYVFRTVIDATSNITDADYFTNSLLFKFSKVYIFSTYGVLGFWGC